jgi:hypothetical protein
MHSTLFVFDGKLMSSEATANAVLTVVALALRRADLTEAQMHAGRSRQRPTPVRGRPFLLCLTEGDPLMSSMVGRC